jgi:hypothetical protein
LVIFAGGGGSGGGGAAAGDGDYSHGVMVVI